MGTNHQDMPVTKLFKLAAALAVLSSIFVATPTTASATGCGGGVLVLRSLHVVAEPSKKVVQPGEKFTVDVTVTRPAHEDPIGQGVTFTPPTAAPAEGVTVGLSVWVGERTYFWQVGMSDAEGKDTLKVKVPKNAEAGEALASASARHWIKSDCPDILEDGYTNYLNFVTVVR